MNLMRTMPSEGMGSEPYPFNPRGSGWGNGCGFFMRFKVNGELFEGVNADTIPGLLRHLDIDESRVAAVEVNLSIVRRADFSSFELKDGDEIEIVNFVGGG